MNTKTKQEILIQNHDLRNNIGAAISHLQMFILDYPEFIDNKNINSAIECINSGISISNAMSHNTNKASTQYVPNSDLELISCHKHIFKIAKNNYEKLSKICPIEITYEYFPLEEDKFIRGDQQSICSLRENIIHNAIKAGATELLVSLKMTEFCLIVSFTDNGCGMTQDKIDEIFMKKSGDGIIHGLGTRSILKTVDNGDGAYINISSTPGEGTTIRILVPYIEM